jgi:hypothetical protein
LSSAGRNFSTSSEACRLLYHTRSIILSKGSALRPLNFVILTTTSTVLSPPGCNMYHLHLPPTLRLHNIISNKGNVSECMQTQGQLDNTRAPSGGSANLASGVSYNKLFFNNYNQFCRSFVHILCPERPTLRNEIALSSTRSPVCLFFIPIIRSK